jgi:hypothetical protein
MSENKFLSIVNNTNADLENTLPSGEQTKGVGSSVSTAKPPEPNSDAAETASGAKSNSAKKSPPKPPSKKLGNRNALCHGIYSNELTLPWESVTDFETLHADFKKEWKPHGVTEEFAVLELANFTWLGMRAAKAALVNYHQIPFGGEELSSGSMSWQDIMQHEGESAEVAVASLTAIKKMLVRLDDLFEKVRNQPHQTGTAKGKEEQMDAVRLGHRISHAIDVVEKVVPTIENLGALTATHWLRFAKAYQPDEIEKQMRVMAMVDARIDKVLRRLVQVKAVKDLAHAQESNLRKVEGPAVAPT